MNETQLVEKFLDTEVGERLQLFYSFLNKQIKNNKWDILVLVGQRTNWIFHIISSYYNLDWSNVKCLSKNNAICEYDETLEGKNIALIKDTIETGKSLFSAYANLKKRYQNVNITPIAIFPVEDLHLSEELIQTKDNWEHKCFKEFHENIANWARISYESQGEFLYDATMLTQELMLPFSLEENFFMINKTIENLENNSLPTSLEATMLGDNKVVMHKDRFERILCGNENWKYIDTSYQFPLKDGKELKSGFFKYMGRDFDYHPNAIYEGIIKCRYKIEDDNAVITFTPSILLDSIPYKDALHIFHTICESRYDEYINKNLLEEAENDSYMIIAKTISYFLNTYLEKLFNEYLQKYDMELIQKTNPFNYISSQFFMNLQNDLRICKKETFEGIIKHFPSSSRHLITSSYCENTKPQSILLARTYKLLFMELRRLNRKSPYRPKSNIFTISELEEILGQSSSKLNMYEKMTFPTDNCMKECIIGTIQNMLDLGILGYDIEYNKSKAKTITYGYYLS